MSKKKEQEAEKFSMLERWKQSNQTVIEFCKEEKIAPHVFYYWNSKYKRQNSNPGKFVKIAAPLVSKRQSPYCELHFTNGTRLVFTEQPSVSFIKQLV